MHFFAVVQYRGAEKLMCRFCGTPPPRLGQQLDAKAKEPSANENPPEASPVESDEAGIERIRAAIREAVAEAEPGREAFERPISRAHAESVAEELTGEACRAYRRKVGKRKLCVLHVEQGEGKVALLFEATDWWLTLRALFSFLKNRGQLPGTGEGGELVPA